MGAGSIVAGIPGIPAAAERNAIGGVDPFSMMNQIMDFRNKQMQYNANMEYGRLANQYANDPVGLQRAAQQSPFAAYMQENIRTLAETQLANAKTTTEGYQQADLAARAASTNFKTGMDVWSFALRNSMGDPRRLQAGVAAGAAYLPESTQRQVLPWLNNTVESYTAGLPSDPTKAKPEFISRAFAGMIMAGVKPEDASVALSGMGPVSMTDVGGAQYPTAQIMDPAHRGIWIGGQGGGYVLGGGGGGGTFGAPVAGANALGGGVTAEGAGGTQQPAAPPGPVMGPGGEVGTGTPAPAAGGGTGGLPPLPRPTTPQEQMANAPAGYAHDGTELYPNRLPPSGLKAPPYGASPTTGDIPMSPDQRSAATGAQKDYDASLEGYKASQINLGTINQYDQHVEHLNKDGGLLTMGAGLDERTDLANSLNTLSHLFGGGNIVSADDVADGQAMKKLLSGLTIQLAKSTFGGQREAASTIQRISESLPVMSNSYLGAKIVSSTIRAFVQREADFYDWNTQWLADKDKDHFGNLYGSATAFNHMHSMDDYLNRNLAMYGMNTDGETIKFNNERDADNAFARGWIPRDVYTKILHDQYGRQTDSERQKQTGVPRVGY